MIKELKEYIDNKYGEYDGSIISGVVQCKYNQEGGLDLYVFSGDIDNMAYMGSIYDNFDICNTTKNFNYNLLDTWGDMDGHNTTPEIILRDCLDSILADNIFEISLITDINENIGYVLRKNK